MSSRADFRRLSAAAVGTAPVRAIDTGARRLAENRRSAAAEFPAMEPMRDRARAIRLHTLAHLDRYLEQFADAAEAAGCVVHFASDAADTNRIVCAIASEHGVGSIVKSKSMVTEEIALNQALEADGRTVVETDLGEFIIQLAGDRPSHIIAPVLHRTRFEVGELFRDRLGVAYTDDPVALNAVARRHLRDIFLKADMGISGANFGVAESGSICLVTNEGNGRLTTTAPPVHVAVMGMERIVPSFGDLAVMLEVLARSATGQRLSVYTNIVTGPRRLSDPDGPDVVHVVIVDNGRSRVLGTDAAEILACVRCGACLNICPVYRRAGGHAYGTTYSGPVGAVLNPALMGQSNWGELAHASSLCGACQEVCPVRIDIPTLLVRSRTAGVASGHANHTLQSAMRAYAAAAVRPPAFRALLKTGALLGNLRGTDSIMSLPFMGRGWTDQRDLRAPARRTFHDRWKDRHGT
jgi:L-lactate dehydrogenase complex protein LldF